MGHKYNQEKLREKTEKAKQKLINKLNSMTNQEREIYISELANRVKRLQAKIKKESLALSKITYKEYKKLELHQMLLFMLSGVLVGAGLGYLVGQLDPEYMPICTGMGSLLGFGIGSFPVVELEDREISDAIVTARKNSKIRKIAKLERKEEDSKEILEEIQNKW